MPTHHNRRRRAPTPAGPQFAGEEWITVHGQGSGFHDCPLCRELAGRTEGAAGSDAADGTAAVEAVVSFRPESLPELLRAGWIGDLLELVGPNATVRVIGHEMEPEPVEELSMATFLARLGYD